MTSDLQNLKNELAELRNTNSALTYSLRLSHQTIDNHVRTIENLETQLREYKNQELLQSNNIERFNLALSSSLQCIIRQLTVIKEKNVSLCLHPSCALIPMQIVNESKTVETDFCIQSPTEEATNACAENIVAIYNEKTEIIQRIPKGRGRPLKVRPERTLEVYAGNAAKVLDENVKAGSLKNTKVKTDKDSRASVDKSAGESTEKSANVSVEKTEKVVSANAEKARCASAEKVSKVSSEKAVKASAENTTGASNDRPSKESSEIATGVSTVKSARSNTERPIRASSERPVRASTERPIRTSTERPVRASTERSARSSTERRASTEKTPRASTERTAKMSTDKYTRVSGDKATKANSEKDARSSHEKTAKSSTEKAAKSSTEKVAKSSTEKAVKASTERAAKATEKVSVVNNTETNIEVPMEMSTNEDSGMMTEILANANVEAVIENCSEKIEDVTDSSVQSSEITNTETLLLNNDGKSLRRRRSRTDSESSKVSPVAANKEPELIKQPVASTDIQATPTSKSSKRKREKHQKNDSSHSKEDKTGVTDIKPPMLEQSKNSPVLCDNIIQPGNVAIDDPLFLIPPSTSKGTRETAKNRTSSKKKTPKEAKKKTKSRSVTEGADKKSAKETSGDSEEKRAKSHKAREAIPKLKVRRNHLSEKKSRSRGKDKQTAYIVISDSEDVESPPKKKHRQSVPNGVIEVSPVPSKCASDHIPSLDNSPPPPLTPPSSSPLPPLSPVSLCYPQVVPCAVLLVDIMKKNKDLCMGKLLLAEDLEKPEVASEPPILPSINSVSEELTVNKCNEIENMIDTVLLPCLEVSDARAMEVVPPLFSPTETALENPPLFLDSPVSLEVDHTINESCCDASFYNLRASKFEIEFYQYMKKKPELFFLS